MDVPKEATDEGLSVLGGGDQQQQRVRLEGPVL